MDSRRDVRVPVNRPIVLTVLGEPEVRVSATVKDASSLGLGLIAENAVKTGSAVKIEIGDAIFLGEVVYCREGDQASFVGVRLSQVLSGLAALSKMVQDFEAFLHPLSAR